MNHKGCKEKPVGLEGERWEGTFWERVVRKGLSEWKSEDSDRRSHADIWVRAFQAEGRAKPSLPYIKSDKSD